MLQTGSRRSKAKKYDIAEFYCLWKKKDGDSCFDVTIWSYDGAQLYEFIDTYLVPQLRTITIVEFTEKMV